MRFASARVTIATNEERAAAEPPCRRRGLLVGWVLIGLLIAGIGWMLAATGYYDYRGDAVAIVEVIVTLEAIYVGWVLCFTRKHAELNRLLAGKANATTRYFIVCVASALVPIFLMAIVSLPGQRFGFHFFWGDAGFVILGATGVTTCVAIAFFLSWRG